MQMGKLEYYTTLPLMPAFAPGRGEQAVPAEFMDTHALRPGNISVLQARDGAAHEMRIGAGDSAGDQTLDGIETILNFGPFDIVQMDVGNSMEDNGSHIFFPERAFPGCALPPT